MTKKINKKILDKNSKSFIEDLTYKNNPSIYTIVFAILPFSEGFDFEKLIVYLNGSCNNKKDGFLRFIIKEDIVQYELYDAIGNVTNLEPGFYVGEFKHIVYKTFEDNEEELMIIGPPKNLPLNSEELFNAVKNKRKLKSISHKINKYINANR